MEEIRLDNGSAQMSGKMEMITNMAHKAMPKTKPGEHIWIIMSCYEFKPEGYVKGEFIKLDKENLLTIEGPACFKCDVNYDSAEGMLPCTGKSLNGMSGLVPNDL